MFSLRIVYSVDPDEMPHDVCQSTRLGVSSIQRVVVGISFVDLLCFFCLVFFMPLCVYLYVPCGHLLGNG